MNGSNDLRGRHGVELSTNGGIVVLKFNVHLRTKYMIPVTFLQLLSFQVYRYFDYEDN